MVTISELSTACLASSISTRMIATPVQCMSISCDHVFSLVVFSEVSHVHQYALCVLSCFDSSQSGEHTASHLKALLNEAAVLSAAAEAKLATATNEVRLHYPTVILVPSNRSHASATLCADHMSCTRLCVEHRVHETWMIFTCQTAE